MKFIAKRQIVNVDIGNLSLFLSTWEVAFRNTNKNHLPIYTISIYKAVYIGQRKKIKCKIYVVIIAKCYK